MGPVGAGETAAGFLESTGVRHGPFPVIWPRGALDASRRKGAKFGSPNFRHW